MRKGKVNARGEKESTDDQETTEPEFDTLSFSSLGGFLQDHHTLVFSDITIWVSIFRGLERSLSQPCLTMRNEMFLKHVFVVDSALSIVLLSPQHLLIPPEGVVAPV